MSAEKILASWAKKDFKPIYWLEGEEDYYIDQLMDYAEHKILPESEAAFNLTIFYGRDAQWPEVINACRRYPMFAERQVVLLKEAQQMRDIDKLEGYIKQPLPSTIFVVSYKEKKLDGRTSLAKFLKKNAEVLTTKKLYDNQLPDWTQDLIVSKGYSIQSKALVLLVDHVGNDLNRISNEIDKLMVNLAGRKTITEEDIEQFIGVSKDYNPFELQSALARKDLLQCIRIIQYFEGNPKAAPIQMVLPTLYNLFSKSYLVCGLSSKDDKSVAAALGLNSTFLIKDYLTAVRNYGFEGLESALLLLHHYNLKSVGVGNSGSGDAALLKELVIKLAGKNV